MIPNESTPQAPIQIDGEHLTIEDVAHVARFGRRVHFNEAARERVLECNENLQRMSSSSEAIYGVNTGFGIFANRRIEASRSMRLSWNLILSHATATGDPFPKDVVRAAMLIRANTLAKGYSGVRPILIDKLLDMLNLRVTPYIPCQGSLGSSGDLAPLAHMALTFSRDPDQPQVSFAGKAWFKSELLDGKEALRAAGIEPIVLYPKEGLALTNGATFANALLLLAYVDICRLLKIAEVSASLSLEALLAVSDAFDERLHEVRPHPGQIAVAQRLRSLTKGSTLVDSSDRVQDAYSLRCIPQVLGPAHDLLDFVSRTLLTELNAATDNPLIFDSEAVSGGNFHGEPIGLAADYLKIALAEVAAIAERRIYRLISEHTNEGLSPMLVYLPENVGFQSGMMMLQYSAASLALENQALASPDSIHSLPTSAGQEDHNSNATLAGRRLMQIVDNVQKILSIELLTSAQALDIRLRQNPDRRPGIGTSRAYEWIRSRFPTREDDYPLSQDIQSMVDLLNSTELLEAVKI